MPKRDSKSKKGGGGSTTALDAVDALVKENKPIIDLIERVNNANQSKLSVNEYINEIKDLLPYYDKIKQYSAKLQQFDKDLVSSWYNKNLTQDDKDRAKLLNNKAQDLLFKYNLRGQNNLILLENTSNKLTSYLKNNGYSNNNTKVDLFREKIHVAGDKSFKNKEQLKQKGYKFTAGAWTKDLSANNILSEVKNLLE